MNLTPHFTLEELTHTDTGLDNTPSADMKTRLQLLAQFLEKVRSRALNNTPISIDDAYRSPAVNAAVGGVPNSAHMEAYAADLTDDEFGPPLAVAQAIAQAGNRGAIVYDQLIYEQHEDGPAGDWVHVSRDPQARMQQLTRLPDGSYIFGLHGRKT